MVHLSKFWDLTLREKQLFCEAFALLLTSHLSIKLVPFRDIYNFLHTHGNDHFFLHTHGNDHFLSAAERDAVVRLVNVSLSRAANLMPWKSLCLSRSIAAFIMLRRSGIPAVIVAGVKVHDSSIVAHAWVCTGRGVLDRGSQETTFTALMRIGQEPQSAKSRGRASDSCATA
jgi:Transglutaminase-like superfamily